MKAKIENFLKWLWLVNGFLAFFWMGLGATFFLIEIIGDLIPHPENAIQVSPTDTTEERGTRAVRYDSPIAIYGSNSRMVFVRYGEAFQPATRTVGPSLGASSYRRGSYFGRQPIVNVIFLDTELEAQTILFDTPAYIENINYPEDEDDSTQRWISYQIAVSDSNGDGVLNGDDEMKMYLSNLNGENFRPILPESMHVTWHNVFGKGTEILIYALENPKKESGEKESFPQRAYVYEVEKETLVFYQSLNEYIEKAERALPR